MVEATHQRTGHASADDPPWVERLAAEGSIRASWLYGPKVAGKASALCFGLGAWGILTGYALFLLLWHERHHPWKFLIALLFAAAASLLVETVRSLILGHPRESLKGPRFVVTILTLAIVELFVVAVHTAVSPSAETLSGVGEAVLGSLVSNRLPPLLNLAVLALLWMVVGGVLSAVLMDTVRGGGRGGTRGRMTSGAGVGALVGLIAPPLTVLIVVLLFRFVGTLWLMVAHHEAWSGHIEAIRQQHWALALLLWPVSVLDGWWTGSFLGRVGGVVVLVAVLAASAKDAVPRRWLLAALAAVFVPPLFSGFGDLLFLLFLSAVVWVVPAAAMGAFAPTLRRPAEDTRTWGVAAFLAGAALFVLTLLRVTDAWFLLPAALLLLTAMLLRRGERLNDYWPLVALTCAMFVTGATWLRQQATFAGVFERFHEANDADLLLTPKPTPVRFAADFGKGIPWDFGSSRLRGGLTDFTRLPSLSTTLGGKRVTLADLMAPTSAWHEDQELTSLSVKADSLFTVAAFHARWRSANDPALEPGRRTQAKRALSSEAAAQGRTVFGVAVQPGDRAYYKAMAERLALDVAEAEAVEKVRADANALIAPVSLETVAPLWDRLTAGLAAWKSPEAKQSAAALLAEVETALSDLERSEAERLLGEERAPGADTGAQRLAKARRLAAAVKSQPWRTAAGRAFAQRSLAALAEGIAGFEKEEGTRLATAAKALESAPEGSRRESAEEVLREVEAQIPAWSTEEGRKDLEEVKALVRRTQESWSAANRRDAARLLELCLCGSLGFWVSVGLLAGWRVLKGGPRVAVGPDGKARCAWATTDVRRRHHDEEYGRVPTDDRDLFRRLSLEILVNDEAWESLPGLAARFHEFDPAKVAAMRLPGDIDPATVRERCDPRPRPLGTKRIVAQVQGETLVIENAKRLLAWESEHAKRGGARGHALFDDWTSRASDPEALVRHVEATFLLRRDTPTATFLQSVGILPGAHANGCEWRNG